MKAIGLIVEYNPLHNGHLYHLAQAKALHPDAIVIAVMSGHFLQRGEPALLDKWTRTKLALAAGIDLVFELPYAHAVQKADQFAYHSVAILHALKVDAIVFGSELGDITPFYDAYAQAQTLRQPQLRPLEQVKQLFAATNNPVFASPNNTLGFWYVSAQQQLQATLTMQTIPRRAAGYHDTAFHGTIASATAIRKGITKNWDYRPVVPDYTATALATEPHCDWEQLYPKLRHILLTTPSSQIARFGLVSEGLESRLIQAAITAESFTSFFAMIQTKRYSNTHLQRVCTHILTQTTQAELDEAARCLHLRLLGANQTGFAYLRTLRGDLVSPVMTNLKQHPSILTALEARATLSYNPRFFANEHARKPVIATHSTD